MKASFLFFFTLVLLSFSVKAQTDSAAHKVQLKLSANYNSNLNYYGRTDSLQSSGFFPLAEVWFTPNFYITAAPVLVHNKAASLQYAGTVATIGYQFNSSKNRIGNIYFVKPFYKQNSRLVQSALKAQSGASLTLLSNFLNLTLGADTKFSDKIDVGTTAGIDHIVRIQNGNNSVIVLDPSVYIYAGTQQFSNSYTKKTSGYLIFPGSSRQVTEAVNNFTILAYEASMPVIYVKGKVQFTITPSYILPQHLIQNQNNPALSERGKTMFYTTAGLKYTF